MNIQNLAYLIKNKEEIPVESGTYYWYHWPQFSDGISKEGLNKLLLKYSNQSLNLDEELIGLKNKVIIKERFFEQKTPIRYNAILGLNQAKSLQLLDFIFCNHEAFIYFQNFFKELCFARPFYIGKAKSLRTRLGNHFDRVDSKILNHISERNISQTEIWITWSLTPPINEEISHLFEEIIQRKLKPGLVEKYGQ